MAQAVPVPQRVIFALLGLLALLALPVLWPSDAAKDGVAAPRDPARVALERRERSAARLEAAYGVLGR